MTGTIFNIQRYSVNDGPGIRTTVFLKGCPLHCKWCYNPESISPNKEVILREDRCIQCGRCIDVCKQHICCNSRTGNQVS
ncbi:MAG: 4Fe-4S cluster-binding domain-containing protein [Bacteroidetes bacterium]|nr:4Fe-4S cluster-binding domain-containing protein [Bacteroidota bacterium]MBU1423673.1 4Fe-4S cluster-binding domain-containing protein [Bacteroidota bacterium]